MHSELIAEHGGRAGIRDDGLLSSALAETNGYLLEAPEMEVVDVMLRLAAGEMEEKDLAGWLKRNSVAGHAD